MAKERPIQSPETKGEFKARGLVKGVDKDKFYVEDTTSTGKPRRKVKFGLQVNADGNMVYVEKTSMQLDKVFFYKNGDKKKNIKGETKAIPFENRDKFNEEGFNPIGMKVGLEKELDKKGQLRNVNKNMFDWDATEYISNNLVEDDAVFVRGNISYSSFKEGSTGERILKVAYEPNQISGVTGNFDMENEKFTETNDFKQKIIFMGIDKSLDPNDSKKCILEAKVVTWNSIEDVEFTVRDSKLAKVLKKNLKPYNAIDVFGKIIVRVEKEEVEDDGWGTNTFDITTPTFVRELLITGADPQSIDTETYTEELIDEDLKVIRMQEEARNNFGDNNNDNKNDEWSASSDDSSDEDWDEDWD